MTLAPHGLARRSVGPAGLWVFGVSASAPMTVLAGGIVTTYAATGVVAVPLSFLLLALALAGFVTGYARAVARAPHAAAFVAVLAEGLGRTTAISGAAVAVLGYNSIQIALYGLLGATLTGLLGGPWWGWALAAWALVAVLGVRGVQLNARIIGIVLAAELALIIAFDIVGLTHPADPAEWLEPLRPQLLADSGIGGVLAFGIAAFIGFEALTSFAEETRDPRQLPATLAATLVFLGGLYTVSAWAMAVVVGPDRIVDVARDPASGIPFSILAAHLGPLVAAAGLGLLVLSILGAMVSFHNVVGRYLYALGREGLLPVRLGITGGAGPGGVPTVASLTQTVVALAVIVGFAVAGGDPLAGLFTWLSTLAAIAVLTLMIAACVAATRLALPRGGPIVAPRSAPARWAGAIAPGAAALALAIVLAVTLSTLGSTLANPSGQGPWLLSGTVALTAAAGARWAFWLRINRPAAFAVAGTGQPRPLAVRDGALRGLPL